MSQEGTLRCAHADSPEVFPTMSPVDKIHPLQKIDWPCNLLCIPFYSKKLSNIIRIYHTAKRRLDISIDGSKFVYIELIDIKWSTIMLYGFLLFQIGTMVYSR